MLFLNYFGLWAVCLLRRLCGFILQYDGINSVFFFLFFYAEVGKLPLTRVHLSEKKNYSYIFKFFSSVRETTLHKKQKFDIKFSRNLSGVILAWYCIGIDVLSLLLEFVLVMYFVLQCYGFIYCCHINK